MTLRVSDKAAAYATLYEALSYIRCGDGTCIALHHESVYQNLVIEPGAESAPDSVHLRIPWGCE